MIAMMGLLALLSGFTAQAYIPEYALIASRAADQHGKGAYQIEQEVSIRREAETVTVKETWVVVNENSMRLTIEGRGALKGVVQGSILYEANTKSFVDANGEGRVQRLGDEWLEPFFHFRSSRYFRSRLVALKVTSPESLRDRGPLNLETARYEPQGFVRLSRVGGSVAWAIGVPPDVGTAPTVWIEQDQFVVRKYRAANQMILRADDYTKYADDFWYPKSRTYTFGSTTVQITTLQVKSLGKLSVLNPARDPWRPPSMDGLREFYLRFR